MNKMTSSLVEAEMEEQYSGDEHHKLVLPCVASQSEDGSPAKEQSPEPKPMERESPESPLGIKRWEIGPFLQSFKSKMATFTEMVMSPVRLFKPTDTLSSIALPDEQEPFMTESNVDNSAHTEEVETEDDAFRNGLFPKRPSSEKMQCNTAPKRHRVVHRLNFCTISPNNNKPVLDQIQMHNEVVPNEENQTDSPSSQSQAVLQNGTHDASPCKAQTPFLKTRTILSTDKTLYSSATHMSSQANVQMDAAVVQNRCSGERETHSSDATCGQSQQSGFSDGDSNLLKPELNGSKNKTCLNKPDAESSSFSTSSGFDLTDKDRSTGGLKMWKSPRKKPLSGMPVSTSSELDTFMTESKDVEMMQSMAECDMEFTEESNPPMSTSVWEVRAKRCRAAPQKKRTLQAEMNCDLENTKEVRPVRNKKFRKNDVTLEINQVDETCVPVRKKRKGVSMMQLHQYSDEPIGTCNTTDVEVGKSVETSEELRPGKVLRSQMRKNVKCRTLLTLSNEGDATDAPSLQNVSLSASIDNTTNGSSESTGFSHPTQPQGPEKTTEARKTRRRLKNLPQRNLCPPKHKSEDYIVTSVVDPAGPSKPSKRALLQSERFISAALEQEMFLSGAEAKDVKELLSCDSATIVHLETKLGRPTKSVKRPRRKDVSIAKRKGVFVGEDDLESKEKATEVPPVVSSSGSGSNRLLRSFSCPEIPSLVLSERHLPRTHMHDSSPTSPSRKSLPAPVPILLHSPSKRTRRHTVCSVEIEREIAPLCLRKEVYPASRGGPSCPSSPYSPSTSLTALASCFLSSPLAFLSKSSSQGRSHVYDASTGSISASSSFVTSSSPPPPSFSSPFTSTLTSCHALTSPSSVVTPSPETPSASVSSLCSAFSQSSLEGDHGVLQMECDEAIGEDEGTNFDLKLTAAISEEKALSDSEIKTDIKDGQREKRVSSIRIRKKIPKPQNNLTPMGLPKVIRIKKKDFSLEEIYTNKNFSKPPVGRLETIFEVPLNQRDGSQAVVGKKKMKRFVKFPELGVVRKPKKPLVGVVAGVGAQRKAGGNSGICRTRRGVGGSRAEDDLTLQELESLLCSKLEELDMWMALQEVAD